MDNIRIHFGAKLNIFATSHSSNRYLKFIYFCHCDLTILGSYGLAKKDLILEPDIEFSCNLMQTHKTRSVILLRIPNHLQKKSLLEQKKSSAHRSL